MYMTLAVAAMYNDRIHCAADVVGISNFNTFLKNTESYRRDLHRVEYGGERAPDYQTVVRHSGQQRSARYFGPVSALVR